ncbi:hypothetical protein ACFFVB_06780 [Formosa undariae]|uniref:B12-binding domain-containing protein n=1 Tax=Formosa undariae TaxID=1325436 RepID=A0ABV5F044_9FLAO
MKSEANVEITSVLKAKTLANTFAAQEGRRPRLLLSKIGQNNHEQDTKIIAVAYADIGFDVDLGPSFQSATDISKQAIENDVHALHLSSLTHETIHTVSEIIASLSHYGCEYILLIVDGDQLTDLDYKTLTDIGVHIIMKSSDNISDTAIQMLTLLIT